jgi:MYXO-CTERM domain-containing protein
MPDCSAFGDQCNTASCDPAGAEGNCDTLTPVADGTVCDDGEVCAVGETCTAGVCGGGVPPVCTDAGGPCAMAYCDPAGAEGNCDTLTPFNDGTACDDSDPCTLGEACLSGACTGGAAPDCSDTGTQCRADATCDPAGADGNCDVPGAPLADGTVCDDGDVCTAGEACVAGECGGGTPPDCSGTGSGCTGDSTCDPTGAEGNCDVPGEPLADGDACDDGDACTTGETCQSGDCTGGDTVDCSGTGDACSGDASCDPDGAEGNCDVPGEPVDDGTACDDQDACTENDTCQAGSCSGDAVDCTPGECHLEGSCDPATGECSYSELPNGTPCSEGVCVDGVCQESAASSSGCDCALASPRSGLTGLVPLLLLALLAARRRSRE